MYDGKRWKDLRRLVIAEEPLCRVCLSNGETSATCEIDHMIPLELGGAPYDRTNLQGLCHECHSRKTAGEVFAR